MMSPAAKERLIAFAEHGSSVNYEAESELESLGFERRFSHGLTKKGIAHYWELKAMANPDGDTQLMPYLSANRALMTQIRRHWWAHLALTALAVLGWVL